ncbi:MAG: prolyl oligopeptidase family serine peptidase [Armatimonadetes bacterium]|nr:prolyl oligopeptidase family serine peptidase [Armatimonadota bacterium]MDW8027498.1 prolyl oligopeptidase family serine peptidase [Armatimonadota bacterium]
MKTSLVAIIVGLMAASSVAQSPKPLANWLVCGPFPFERSLQQFLTDHLTEQGGEAKIRPKEGMTHTVKGLGKVAWQRHYEPDGILDFVSLIARPMGEERPKFWQLRYGLAYAYTEIVSDRSQRALLLLGSEDWIAVWFNGELVHENFVYRHCVPDKDAVLVNLREGTNKLLVKVARIAGGWGVSAKIVAPVERKIFVKTDRYNPCPPDGNMFLPEIREGETVPVWGYVTVVNTIQQTLPFVLAQVRENEWFAETNQQIGQLTSGESSQLPFLIAPKRPLKPDEKLRLHLVVRTAGEQQEFDLPITVRRKDEPFFTTHRSRIDSSVQPMALLVPPDYNPHRSYPLVVALHGSKGCLIGHAFSVKPDFIIVAPHGRGQTGYRDFGEVDIFEAMEEVKKRYRIDEDRIYLTGHSMGGGGTFRLATRYPHLWAAVAPMASGGARPFEWLKNLLHIPTLFYHGSEDEVVPVQMARQAANYISQLGYNFRYEEVKGKPHWWGVDFPEMFAFFAQYRLVKSPDRIVFWTSDSRANRAYWIEIADFVDYTKPANIEAGMSDGGQRARLVLTTENVSEIVLHLNEAPESLKQLPLVVEWNGCKAIVAKRGNKSALRLKLQTPFVGVEVEGENCRRYYQWQRDGELLYLSEEGKKHVALVFELPLTEGRRKFGRAVAPKTPKLCGPATDALSSPFIVAYDSESEGAKLAAKRFQHWWRNYALGVCHLVEFRNADEFWQLLKTSNGNLVVFQRANAWARFGDIVFEREGVRIGKQHFEGKLVAVRALLPNPFRPQNYLLLNASTSDEGLRLLSYIPMDIGRPYDYLVADERFLKEGIKGVLAIGQWLRNWKAQ